MANPELLAILNQGVNAWNTWRSEHPAAEIDLAHASLARAPLNGANLASANLMHAELSSVELRNANLSGANLEGANLSVAFLTGANLTGASLNNAKLYGAFLTRANLHSAYLLDTNFNTARASAADFQLASMDGADLTNAIFSASSLKGADLQAVIFRKTFLDDVDFQGARLLWTVFAGADLAGARNLDACVHDGPSFIDFRTLELCGSLPEGFLRGCGLSDSMIDYLPSLCNRAIRYYSCFISYSTHDQEFAEKLFCDLQANDVRCWFAPHNVQGGRKLHEQIDDAINLHDKLLLVLSDASMNSEWVKTEISKARRRERREGRRMLFPVRLVDFERLRAWECFDGDVGKDSAREVREYYVPDFTNWQNPDSYQVELAKLLNDLKMSGSPNA